MNEQDFTAKVKGHLDASVDDLPPEVLGRLQSARQQALTQLRSQRETAKRATNPFTQHWKISAPAFAILALAVGYVAFNLFGDSPEQAIHELEAEMLSHELPPHSFIDPGFEQWLKRDSKP